LSRLIVPAGRPPIFIGAGVFKEAGQIRQVAAADTLTAIVIGSFSLEAEAGNGDNGRYKVEYWDAENQANN
jgi:dihydroorotate dehydrogenase